MATRHFQARKINLTLSPTSNIAAKHKNKKDIYYRRWNQQYKNKIKQDNAQPQMFNDADYFFSDNSHRTFQSHNNFQTDDGRKHVVGTCATLQKDKKGRNCIEFKEVSSQTSEIWKLNVKKVRLRKASVQSPSFNPKKSLLISTHTKNSKSLTFSSRECEKSKVKNPYTNQDYLYTRKKSKQDKEQSLEKRKRQIFSNILKPCQISQIQIGARDDLQRVNERGLQFIKNNSLMSYRDRQRRAKTARNPNLYDTLQPWEAAQNYTNCLEDVSF